MKNIILDRLIMITWKVLLYKNQAILNPYHKDHMKEQNIPSPERAQVLRFYSICSISHAFRVEFKNN